MGTYLNDNICKSSPLDIAPHQLLFGISAVSIYGIASCTWGLDRNLTGPLLNSQRNALQSGTHPKPNNYIGDNIDDLHWRKKMKCKRLNVKYIVYCVFIFYDLIESLIEAFTQLYFLIFFKLILIFQLQLIYNQRYIY